MKEILDLRGILAKILTALSAGGGRTLIGKEGDMDIILENDLRHRIRFHAISDIIIDSSWIVNGSPYILIDDGISLFVFLYNTKRGWRIRDTSLRFLYLKIIDWRGGGIISLKEGGL